MTENTKKSLLNYFNTLKSFGYSYHNNIDVNYNQNTSTLLLPNNINDLKTIVNNCYLCPLSKTRKNVLFSTGNITSDVIFIIDEPSASDDELGHFYTGKTGEMLSKMITNVLKLDINNIYLTSLVKCRSNDNLSLEDYEKCSNYLSKQIELIKPKLLVFFGERTYRFFTKNDDFLKVRGKEFMYNGNLILTTYAPSFLLRNPSFKKESYADMIKIKSLLE